MKRLIILVGNIGTGKSTLVHDLVKLGYIIISRDALRYMIGGGEYVFDLDTEKIIKKTAISMLRQLVRKKFDVVIDETNMSIEQRAEMLAIANKAGYTTTAIILPRISKKKSIERRLSNNHGNTTKKVWGEVWERFNAMYEEPTADEGFDKIRHKLK